MAKKRDEAGPDLPPEPGGQGEPPAANAAGKDIPDDGCDLAGTIRRGCARQLRGVIGTGPFVGAARLRGLAEEWERG